MPCLSTGIECSALADILDGTIAYSTDMTIPYDFGTTATYFCDSGFSLVGNNIRTCGGDGSSVNGVWDLSEPSCQCKFSKMVS